MVLRQLAKLMTTIVFCVSVIGTVVITAFFYYGRGLPEYDHLQHYMPPTSNRVYDKNHVLIKEMGLERRIWTPLSEIPPLVIKAFLSAEDKNFYYHFGIDIIGLARATFVNTITQSWKNRPGGASTITQQVAKNFLIGNERSLARKAKEAIMSMRLEGALSKDRILELYLNQIYLGTGAYGVTSAALTYFNKSLADLTLEEVAFLAALPKAPSTYASDKEFTRLKIRRDWVLDRMVIDGLITPQEGEAAKSKPISVTIQQIKESDAGYFIEEVRRELVKRFDKRTLDQGGLTIHTTLDTRLQTIANEALRDGLIAYDRRHGWRGPILNFNLHEIDFKDDIVPHVKKGQEAIPQWLAALQEVPPQPGSGIWKQAIVLEVTAHQAKIGFKDGTIESLPYAGVRWARPCLKDQEVGPEPLSVSDVLHLGDVILVSESASGWRLEQIPDVTGALVVLDQKTGHVLAMSGGYSFELSQFNCATQAMRQPGSTFKPFVYLTALECGFTPDTKIVDEPISISLGTGMGMYEPKNHGKKFYGPTSLSRALAYSRNVVTIRLAQRIGMKSIVKTANDFNICENLPRQLAMALGAGSTTLIKLTNAYGMIANGGQKITPNFIESVLNRKGMPLFMAESIEGTVASEEPIEKITEMLYGVVEFGTAKRLNKLNIPIAGKTGSTNDYKDGFFVGFTKDFVIGIFVGFPTPRTMGEGETGGRVAVPIAETFFRLSALEH